MPEGADSLAPVRGAVRRLLEGSPSYRALPLEERKRLANDMVKVGSFLADPGWLEERPAARPLEEEKKADPILDLKKRLADKPGQVGAEFQAGAVRQGVEEFGKLVQKVDFPAFVSGLVQGVFKAVVDASIDQMRAYGELLSASAKTVDQFASDHITDGQARDFVANKYPSLVEVDTTGEEGSRLRMREGAEDTVGLGQQFGMKEEADLSSAESETALVNAAKLEMARQRQQLMATMVLLGINRIVVTDGRINAKVVFDMRADDSSLRKAKAELHDKESEKSHVGGQVGLPWSGFSASSSSAHMAQVSSAVDDTSQSRAEVKANLTGEVRLNFKSETFPLERMVDAGGLEVLNQRAQPGAPGSAGAARR